MKTLLLLSALLLGQVLSGETAPSYEIDNPTTDNSGAYWCVMITALGSATSQIITVTVPGQ